jgi:hypothetical protein
MSDYGFPTETIELPSKGLLYPEGSPLRSGTVDVKYMTAKEEDILTSTNLIQKGTVLDKLLESLIVTKGVKPDDLLAGDLNAVLVASRILAYGKDYEVQLPCSSCGKRFDYTIDLTQLDMTNPESNPINGEFTVKLPTGVDVSFRLLTRKDEKNIEQEVEAIKKIDNTVQGDTPTRLRYMITAVNGNRDKKVIREFSESMIIRDLRAFREEIKRVTPDVNFDLTVTCTSCETSIKARMPFGASFFWPDLGA